MVVVIVLHFVVFCIRVFLVVVHNTVVLIDFIIDAVFVIFDVVVIAVINVVIVFVYNVVCCVLFLLP